MLKVTLPGTGATMPLPHRATATGAIQYQGHNILLDCGEGTQTAARRADVSLVKIDCICLTHYHGDHIFGLPGLLQTMASQGRTQPVLLLGPAKDYAQTIGLLLALAGELPFPVVQRPQASVGQSMTLWDGLHLTSFPLFHRAPCVGYRFDLPRAGEFSPEKAQALGVDRRLWGQLQKGNAVPGIKGRMIQPAEVLGPPRKGLSVVYALDTAPCESLVAAAQGADLLICDATYSGAVQEELDKAALYGHTTFGQCARMAVQAGVKKLWLTHYGGALTSDPDSQLWRAQEIFPAAETGFDGKTILLKFED